MHPRQVRTTSRAAMLHRIDMQSWRMHNLIPGSTLRRAPGRLCRPLPVSLRAASPLRIASPARLPSNGSLQSGAGAASSHPYDMCKAALALFDVDTPVRYSLRPAIRGALEAGAADCQKVGAGATSMTPE